MTPGPWICEGLTIKAVSHGQWFKIAKADGLHHTREGNAANARLMAAAPDLLQALKRWAQYAEDNGYRTDPFSPSYCDFLQDTLNAIAEAEQ